MPAIPIISLVGHAKVGKTTYLEKLIPELASRGYRVAAVKHDVHDFEIDIPGKDSHRLKAAGAKIAIISSPKKLAFVRDTDHDLSLDEIRRQYVGEVDLIISEGYKRDTHPKIEIVRNEMGSALTSEKMGDLFAIASDSPLKSDAPVFDINDIHGMADLIEDKYLKK